MITNYINETGKILETTDLQYPSTAAYLYLEEVAELAGLGNLEIVRIYEYEDFCDVVVRETENRIKKARKESGITQAEAAECLGIPKRTLQDWEDGRRNPRVDVNDIINKLHILSAFTKEGRKAIASNEISWAEAERQYKIQEAKSFAKCGKYPGIFTECLNRIPESIIESITPDSLGCLIDAIKCAYDDGVNKGK